MMRGLHILPLVWLATMSFPVQAEETRREEFGDWGFVCTQPAAAEAKENCNLFQAAVLSNETAEQGQRVLLTRVGYVEGNENPLLLVTAPLGILLPPGITVEVAGHDTIRLPVQRCDGGGCLAYVVMEQPFIEAFRKAAAATVTFYDAQRQAAEIPLSLKGFTAGMKALEQSRSTD